MELGSLTFGDYLGPKLERLVVSGILKLHEHEVVICIACESTCSFEGYLLNNAK